MKRSRPGDPQSRPGMERKARVRRCSSPPLCQSTAPTGHREAPPRPDPLPVPPVRNRVPMGAPGTPRAKSNPRAEVTAGLQTGAKLQRVPVPHTEPVVGRELQEPPRSESCASSLCTASFWGLPESSGSCSTSSGPCHRSLLGGRPRNPSCTHGGVSTPIRPYTKPQPLGVSLPGEGEATQVGSWCLRPAS